MPIKAVKVKTYIIPVVCKDCGYAYVEATSKKEAKQKFDDGDMRVVMDSDLNHDSGGLKQDGAIEIYEED